MKNSKYCKYCGLELENHSCSCDNFKMQSIKSNIKTNNLKNIICDTCGKTNDFDAQYCEYCGIPLHIDGNIKKLQKELCGADAIDVINFYSKNNKSKSKMIVKSFSFIITMLIIVLIIGVTFGYIIRPYVNDIVDKYLIRSSSENDNNDINDSDNESNIKSTSESLELITDIVETSQPLIELKDMWIKQDGFYYCFDKDGLPVVDDWVTEIDENGVEKKYYFDIDGKLVINSWIDGEYYVGSDGAMLRNQATPDGAFVDEDGRVLLMGGDTVPVVQETFVYYEFPDESSQTKAMTQKSSTTGEIKGIDPNKQYELYIKNIKMVRNTIAKNDLKCNFVYYIPTFDGANEKEVLNINNAFNEVFVTQFSEIINKYALNRYELPKSIVFNVVEQRSLNSNRINILIHGRLVPRSGLNEKLKFRFIYDRKSKKITVTDISE